MPSDDRTLAERFHFADFTRDQYRELLRIAKRSYVFRSYADFARDERFVLWRHDVDFSPHAARNLARIEAEEGVRATYFVHVHSEFYNLLERDVAERVREILALGHDLGLHFDAHFHGVGSEEELDTLVRRESALLEQVFDCRVSAFSFHNTNEFTMACRRWTYGGVINAYADYFQRDVGYCSDSNGHWRYRRLRDVLETASDERLQVLTHPDWWQAGQASPRAKVYRAILGRAAKTSAGYAELLASVGTRNNVSEFAAEFDFVRSADPQTAAYLEALWFGGRAPALLAELLALHARQLWALSHVAAPPAVLALDCDAAVRGTPAASPGFPWELSSPVGGAELARLTGLAEDGYREAVAAAMDAMRGMSEADSRCRVAVGTLLTALHTTAVRARERWGVDGLSGARADAGPPLDVRERTRAQLLDATAAEPVA